MASRHYYLELPSDSTESEGKWGIRALEILEAVTADLDGRFEDAGILKPEKQPPAKGAGSGGPPPDAVTVLPDGAKAEKYRNLWQVRGFRRKEDVASYLSGVGLVSNDSGNNFATNVKDSVLTFVLPKEDGKPSAESVVRDLLGNGALATVWFRCRFNFDLRHDPPGASIGHGLHNYYRWSHVGAGGECPPRLGGNYPHLVKKLQEQVKAGRAPTLDEILKAQGAQFSADPDTMYGWSVMLADFMRNRTGAKPKEYPEMLRALARLGPTPKEYPKEIILGAFKESFKSTKEMEAALYKYVQEEAAGINDEKLRAATEAAAAGAKDKAPPK
jgi:hypothetical protein